MIKTTTMMKRIAQCAILSGGALSLGACAGKGSAQATMTASPAAPTSAYASVYSNPGAYAQPIQAPAPAAPAAQAAPCLLYTSDAADE